MLGWQGSGNSHVGDLEGGEWMEIRRLSVSTLNIRRRRCGGGPASQCSCCVWGLLSVAAGTRAVNGVWRANGAGDGLSESVEWEV